MINNLPRTKEEFIIAYVLERARIVLSFDGERAAIIASDIWDKIQKLTKVSSTV